MRSNIIIGLLALGLAASLGVILLQSRSPRLALPESSSGITAAPQPAAEAMPPAVKPVAVVHSPTATTGQTGDETPEQRHEAYVAARSAELMDLAMNNDADSLNTILSELANRDRQIRDTAVQAAVQFHSRDAIPRLQDAALQTDDAKERAAIEDAIEFLKLPSLTEVMARQAQQATSSVASPPAIPAPAK